MMIVHIVSTPTKVTVDSVQPHRLLIDRYVVYCSWQRSFLCEMLSVPREHVVLSTFMVDTDVLRSVIRGRSNVSA